MPNRRFPPPWSIESSIELKKTSPAALNLCASLSGPRLAHPGGTSERLGVTAEAPVPHDRASFVIGFNLRDKRIAHHSLTRLFPLRSACPESYKLRPSSPVTGGGSDDTVDVQVPEPRTD